MSQVECNYCGKVFDSDSKLTEHLASDHTTDELSRIDRKKVEQYSKQNTLTSRVRDVRERQPVTRRGALTVLGAGVAGVVGMGGQALGDTSDFAGGSGEPDDPYQIANWNHLDNVRTEIDDGDSFELIQDLDSETDGYEEHVKKPSKGFDPIGPDFTGTFDGNGHTISDVDISGSDYYVGLFKIVAGTVRNLTISSANVTNTDGTIGTGVLAGQIQGTAENIAVADSSVDGGKSVGGLTGLLNGGIVRNTSISGTEEIKGGNSDPFFGAHGGLIGTVYNGGRIEKCETSVTIKGIKGVGGILGKAVTGSISIIDSAVTGNVEGTELNHDGGTWPNGQTIGGLVGAGGSADLTIKESYTTGTITGTEKVGGLVGEGPPTLTIEQSYSTADITATESSDPDVGDRLMNEIGGLVGSGGIININNSYTASNITVNNVGAEPKNVGGILGGQVTDSQVSASDTYWDTTNTGLSDAAGDDSLTATGLTTSEMQGTAAETNMSDLIDSGAWLIVGTDPVNGGYESDGYPILVALERDSQLKAQGITPPVGAIDINADNVTIKNNTIISGEDT